MVGELPISVKSQPPRKYMIVFRLLNAVATSSIDEVGQFEQRETTRKQWTMGKISRWSRWCSQRFCCRTIIFTACIGLVSSTHHPLMHMIHANEKQCILKRFNRGDFATFEIFIAEADENGRPSASVEIHGPVIPPEVGEVNNGGERTWPNNVATDAGVGDSTGRFAKPPFANTLGASMQKVILNWDGFVRDNARRLHEVGMINYNYVVDYTHSGESEDAIAAREEFYRQRATAIGQLEEERQRTLERRKLEGGAYSGNESVEDEQYELTKAYTYQTFLPEYIEPHEWTKPIKMPGWYRMCVTSHNYILAEMDIRSSEDLGGVNRETGHVYTYDERATLDEEELIKGLENSKAAEEVEKSLVKEELEKLLENQVNDFDLKASKSMLLGLNELVALMQKRQTNVHHRIKGHEGDARRNYKKIVRSGILETLLYLFITLFQIYTLRKWLLRTTVLGR